MHNPPNQLPLGDFLVRHFRGKEPYVRNLKSRLQKGLAVFAILVLTAVGVNAITASPAAADGPPGPICPSGGYVCLYSNVGGYGSTYYLQGARYNCYNLPSYFNDIASSARNTATYSIRLWEHAGCTGWAVGLNSGGSGTSAYIMDLWVYGMNDKITSISFY
jgi:hypothetical protein